MEKYTKGGLTLLMLRLLSSEAQDEKILDNYLNSVMVVFIDSSH